MDYNTVVDVCTSGYQGPVKMTTGKYTIQSLQNDLTFLRHCNGYTRPLNTRAIRKRSISWATHRALSRDCESTCAKLRKVSPLQTGYKAAWH